MTSFAQDSAETRKLLEQVRAGEQGAEERLLDQHRSFLVRLVELRLDPRLRPRLDPSDVAQEAQLEAHRRLHGYLEGPPMPFRLWLRRLAYDRLLMLYRQHLRAAQRSVARDVLLPDRSSLLLANQFLAAGSTPSEGAIRREPAERVRRALDQLPEAEREVLILRDLEGLSN